MVSMQGSMRELVLRIMLEIVAVSLYAIQGFVLAWYCGKFAQPGFGGTGRSGGGLGKTRFARNFVMKYGITITWMIVRELFSNLWDTQFQPVMTIVKQVLVIAVLYFCIWLFYDVCWQMRLYLCGTYTAIGEICLFLVLELNQFQKYVFQGCLWMFEHGKWDYDCTMAVMDTAAFILQIFTNIIYLVVFWKLIWLLADKFRYKKVKLGKKELAYLLSPTLLGWVLGLLFRGMFYTMEDGEPHFLYDRYPILHVFIPLILITILTGIVSTILLYQDLVEKNEKQLSMRVLEQQLEGMQAQLREIERVNEANRHMRHDMKNILSVALNLCEEISENPDRKHPDSENPNEKKQGDENSDRKSINKQNELRQYLKDAEISLRKTDFRFRTGDGAVDSMLSMKYYEAIRLVPGILYDTEEFLLPRDMKIHGFDLCIILGNALDNSITANERLYARKDATEKCYQEKCHQKRYLTENVSVETASEQEYFIKISTKGKGQTILIEIKNPFTGELRQEAGEEYPSSLKADAQGHGIGMRNMQRIAEKYCGNVAFQSDGNIFTLWVLLQNQPPVDFEA